LATRRVSSIGTPRFIWIATVILSPSTSGMKVNLMIPPLTIPTVNSKTTSPMAREV